ncbi:hypothetical protein M758_4G072000 [Ceratodon purpureus]|nr:hypothetical protein M758_4G072000 [Ceratodon purpureus]
MSSHVALSVIGTVKATSQSFESLAERSHKSSSQHSHVQVPRKATHVKSLERNLKDLSLEELVAVADRVKTNTIAVLRLFVTPHESHEGNYDFYVFYDNITELI